MTAVAATTGFVSAASRESFPRENSLQWLRLVFAIQVVINHSSAHLGSYLPPLIMNFPGVPAFFFVSGFLIYDSYRNNGGADYFRNRFLRLFPALFVVTLAGLGVALVAHGWRDLIENPALYGAWVFAQLTLGQAWNPAHFRDIGVGVINGALWTITTEILFYLAVPVIVWMERRFRATVPVLMAISFAIYALGPSMLTYPIRADRTVYDLLALTPVAWGWMFGFGILAVKYYSLIPVRWLWLGAIPMIPMIAFGEGPLFGTEQPLGLFYFVSYVAVIMWLAFAVRLPRLKPDFSYGVYIWHMPVINLVLVTDAPNKIPVAWGLVALAAALSWYLIERPAERLKRRSIKDADPVAAAPP